VKSEISEGLKLWEDDDFENYNNFCSQQLLKIQMALTRILGRIEKVGRKFNAIVLEMRILPQGFQLNM
jgi:hypothetical protein